MWWVAALGEARTPSARLLASDSLELSVPGTTGSVDGFDSESVQTGVLDLFVSARYGLSIACRYSCPDNRHTHACPNKIYLVASPLSAVLRCLRSRSVEGAALPRSHSLESRVGGRRLQRSRPVGSRSDMGLCTISPLNFNLSSNNPSRIRCA
mgnify:CR=1 FL=1